MSCAVVALIERDGRGGGVGLAKGRATVNKVSGQRGKGGRAT